MLRIRILQQLQFSLAVFLPEGIVRVESLPFHLLPERVQLLDCVGPLKTVCVCMCECVCVCGGRVIHYDPFLKINDQTLTSMNDSCTFGAEETEGILILHSQPSDHEHLAMVSGLTFLYIQSSPSSPQTSVCMRQLYRGLEPWCVCVCVCVCVCRC